MDFKQQLLAVVSRNYTWSPDFIPLGEKKYQTEILRLIDESVSQENEELLYRLFGAADRDGLDKTYTSVLCNLLKLDWHKGHEDIAEMLEAIKDPASIESLYNATFFEVDEETEARPLTIKCIYALNAINTREAKEKIKKLTTAKNSWVNQNAGHYSG